MAKNTVTVANAAELKAALSNATGGETILLKAGNYGGLYLKGENFSSQVTIKSETANAAKITKLDVANSSNIAFEDMTFDYTSNGEPIYYTPFAVGNSSNISFKDSVFDGDTAGGRGTATGLRIKDSSDVTVEGSEFTTWTRGMLVINTTDIRVADNDVHSIRSDGMNFVDVYGATVESNYIHDFKTAANSGDHPDMIQFFKTGKRPASSDVVIRDNILDKGAGDTTQSLFMGAGQAPKTSDYYYKNITIENNVVYGNHTHGISVDGVHGLTIKNNSLYQVDGALSGGVSQPQIRAHTGSTNVNITDNVATGIKDPGGQPGWNISDNTILKKSDYGSNLVMHKTAGSDGYNQFGVKKGSQLDANADGSSIVDQYPFASDAWAGTSNGGSSSGTGAGTNAGGVPDSGAGTGGATSGGTGPSTDGGTVDAGNGAGTNNGSTGGTDNGGNQGGGNAPADDDTTGAVPDTSLGGSDADKVSKPNDDDSKSDDLVVDNGQGSDLDNGATDTADKPSSGGDDNTVDAEADASLGDNGDDTASDDSARDDIVDTGIGLPSGSSDNGKPSIVDGAVSAPDSDSGSGSVDSDKLVLDDYVLDTNSIDRFRGGAHVAQDKIVFDGHGDSVGIGRQKQFENSKNLAYSVEFSREEADGSFEKLVWNHMKMGLAVEGDGLRVYAANEDAPMYRGFKIKDLGLNDTDTHSVTVLMNETSDRLQVVVDDEVVYDENDTDLDFVGGGGREWGWSLGSPWGRSFSGEISDFAIDDDLPFIDQDDASGVAG